MYSILFNKITDVIEELQQIQQETEELYIREQINIAVIKFKENDSKN